MSANSNKHRYFHYYQLYQKQTPYYVILTFRNKVPSQCGLSLGDAVVTGQVGEPLRLKKLVFGRIAEMDGGGCLGELGSPRL